MTVRITACQHGAIRRIQVAGRLTGEEVAERENAVGDDDDPRASTSRTCARSMLAASLRSVASEPKAARCAACHTTWPGVSKPTRHEPGAATEKLREPGLG